MAADRPTLMPLLKGKVSSRRGSDTEVKAGGESSSVRVGNDSALAPEAGEGKISSPRSVGAIGFNGEKKNGRIDLWKPLPIQSPSQA